MGNLMAMLLGVFSRSVFINFSRGTFIREPGSSYITAYTVDGYTFILTDPTGIIASDAALAALARDKRINHNGKANWKIYKNDGSLFNLTSIDASVYQSPQVIEPILALNGTKSDNSHPSFVEHGPNYSGTLSPSNLTQLKSLQLSMKGLIGISSITFEDTPMWVRYIPASFVVVVTIFAYFLSR
jgi:hypothetical protein